MKNNIHPLFNDILKSFAELPEVIENARVKFSCYKHGEVEPETTKEGLICPECGEKVNHHAH